MLPDINFTIEPLSYKQLKKKIRNLEFTKLLEMSSQH